MLHGRDPERSGPADGHHVSVCLFGETVRALSQETADSHLGEHVDEKMQRCLAA